MKLTIYNIIVNHNFDVPKGKEARSLCSLILSSLALLGSGFVSPPRQGWFKNKNILLK